MHRTVQRLFAARCDAFDDVPEFAALRQMLQDLQDQWVDAGERSGELAKRTRTPAKPMGDQSAFERSEVLVDARRDTLFRTMSEDMDGVWKMLSIWPHAVWAGLNRSGAIQERPLGSWTFDDLQRMFLSCLTTFEIPIAIHRNGRDALIGPAPRAIDQFRLDDLRVDFPQGAHLPPTAAWNAERLVGDQPRILAGRSKFSVANGLYPAAATTVPALDKVERLVTPRLAELGELLQSESALAGGIPIDSSGFGPVDPRTTISTEAALLTLGLLYAPHGWCRSTAVEALTGCEWGNPTSSPHLADVLAREHWASIESTVEFTWGL